MFAQGIQIWRKRFGTEAPPSTGLKEALQWLMLARLVALYLVLFVIVVQQVFRRESLTGSSLLLGYGLLTLSFAFNLIHLFFVERISIRWVVALSHILFDALVTSVWIYFSGGRESLFALVYLIQILAVSLILYQRGAVAASLIAIACFGTLTGLHYQPGGLVSFGVFSTLFLVLGLVGGYLSEELLRTNESLREKSRKVDKLVALNERIIADIPTGLLTVDRHMKINFLNPAGEQILGRSAKAVVGVSLLEIDPDLLPFFSQIESDSVAEAESGESGEADPAQSQVFESKGGSLPGRAEAHRNFFVQSKSNRGGARLQQTVEIHSGAQRRILRGDVAGLEPEAGLSGLLGEEVTGGRVLLFQDVTKLVHLEEKLRQNEKLAAVGQLAAGIAHEIRNPLASMSASIQMLKDTFPDGGVDDENRKLMDIAIREIDRLNLLVSEFLDYVRPDNLKFTEVDIQLLFSEVLLSVRRSKDFQERISIREDFQATPLAKASAEKLKQVIWNLVINAIQSMKGSGTLEVGSSRHGGTKVKFWVQDQGQGMSEEVLAHLYEPFFTTKDRGTGLGLATAYKIIEAHHGEILVTSKVGSGTRFEILLPGA